MSQPKVSNKSKITVQHGSLPNSSLSVKTEQQNSPNTDVSKIFLSVKGNIGKGGSLPTIKQVPPQIPLTPQQVVPQEPKNEIVKPVNYKKIAEEIVRERTAKIYEALKAKTLEISAQQNNLDEIIAQRGRNSVIFEQNLVKQRLRDVEHHRMELIQRLQSISVDIDILKDNIVSSSVTQSGRRRSRKVVKANSPNQLKDTPSDEKEKQHQEFVKLKMKERKHLEQARIQRAIQEEKARAEIEQAQRLEEEKLRSEVAIKKRAQAEEKLRQMEAQKQQRSEEWNAAQKKSLELGAKKPYYIALSERYASIESKSLEEKKRRLEEIRQLRNVPVPRADELLNLRRDNPESNKQAQSTQRSLPYPEHEKLVQEQYIKPYFQSHVYQVLKEEREKEQKLRQEQERIRREALKKRREYDEMVKKEYAPKTDVARTKLEEQEEEEKALRKSQHLVKSTEEIKSIGQEYLKFCLARASKRKRADGQESEYRIGNASLSTAENGRATGHHTPGGNSRMGVSHSKNSSKSSPDYLHEVNQRFSGLKFSEIKKAQVEELVARADSHSPMQRMQLLGLENLKLNTELQQREDLLRVAGTDAARQEISELYMLSIRTKLAMLGQRVQQ